MNDKVVDCEIIGTSAPLDDALDARLEAADFDRRRVAVRGQLRGLADFDRRRVAVRGQLRGLAALFGEPVAAAIGDKMEALEESAYDAFQLYERALAEKATIIDNLQREIERLSINLAAEHPQPAEHPLPIDTFLQPIDGVGPQIVPNEAIDEAATWIWRTLLSAEPF